MGKRASHKPSEAESGGNFGFPKGSIVTILEAEYSTWGEAGERAITRGRKATDPALKLVGELEGVDGDPRTVFLGCGKSERLEPSSDGQFLEIAEGSSATAESSSCDSHVFKASIFGKPGDKNCDAFKRHGKNMLNEDMLDDGITSALVGLKFVAGGEIIKRNFEDSSGEQRKERPSLVVDEILEAPSGEGKKTKKKTTKPVDDDDDDEAPVVKKSKKPAATDNEDEDEAPAPKKGKGKVDSTARAEKFGVEALTNPKYRKGCPQSKFYVAVHNVCRDEDDADAIMKLVGDEEWAQDDARPWVYDSEEEVYKSA